jgi:hypothetical protein
MKRRIPPESLIYVMLVIGLLGVFALLLQRAGWDKENRRVMLVFDAVNYSVLAQQGAAVTLPSPTTIGVPEATILSLSQLGYIASEQEGTAGKHIILQMPATLLFGFGDLIDTKGLEGRISNSLSWQLIGGYMVRVSYGLSGNKEYYYCFIDLPPITDEQANSLALGFYMRPEFPLPAEHKFVFRPNGSGMLDEAAIAQKYSWIPKEDASKLVLFSGDQVPGFPLALKAAADKLPGDLGMVEFSKQDGDKALASKVAPSRVYWVHSIPVEEMPPLTPQAMVDRYLRALRERNPRVLYIHPISASQYLTPGGAMLGTVISGNARFLEQLKASMAEEGFTPSLELKNPAKDPPSGLRWAAMFLCYLAAMWFVVLFFPGGKMERFFTSIVTQLSFILLSYPASESAQVVSLAALAAAILFPLVGLGFAVRYYTRHPLYGKARIMPLRVGLTAFGICFIMALLGGVIVYSLLTSVATFAKMEAFHGVMLARSLPVLIALVFFFNLKSLAWTDWSRNLYGRVNRALGYQVSYLDLALILILGAAMGVALLRSGNDFGMLVSSPETTVRGTLEQLFGVRPRTTELLGNFSLIAFFMLLPWGHRSLLLLLAAGTMALCSVVNTFSHLHTPIMISIERALLGLAISLVVALGAYVACWIAAKLYLWASKLGGKPSE